MPICWREMRKSCPVPEAMRRPDLHDEVLHQADPPVPMVMPLVMIFSTATSGRMNPLEGG